jgi:hypothetical protein
MEKEYRLNICRFTNCAHLDTYQGDIKLWALLHMF